MIGKGAKDELFCAGDAAEQDAPVWQHRFGKGATGAGAHCSHRAASGDGSAG